MTENEIIEQAKADKIRREDWMAKERPGYIPDYELSEMEVESAIHRANVIQSTNQAFAELQAASRARTRIEKQKLAEEWNYERFFRLMRSRAREEGQELIYSEGEEGTAKIIKALCFKMSGDPRYETELGFDFRKCLILKGNRGRGKTWLPSLVKDNPFCPIQIVNMNFIKDCILDTGQYHGLKFSSHSLVEIDDVGTEYGYPGEKIMYMGSNINWFRHFFETMYFKAKPLFGRVILSTNDSFDVLEEKYGASVRDRMAEVCDVLDVKGTSLRRKP